MKHRRILSMLLCLLILASLPIAAFADTGPKPSVTVKISGLGEELCYGTLLSLKESTGPAQAWDGNEENAWYPDGQRDIWQAFVDYEDSDGYYFLQQFWQVNETKALNWTYYPPQSFKLLLYFPESDSFAVSGVYERYAFDSRFAVDADTMELTKSSTILTEFGSLLIRIVLTIAIELAVALLFGYRDRKQIRFITVVNVCTQIVLNVLLTVADYRSGPWASLVALVFGELIVFVVEAVLYCIRLDKLSEKSSSKGKAFAYAFVANLASLMLGRFILLWLSV